MEEIKIERNNEFEEQRREDILKGSYAKLEVLISKDNPELPLANFVLHGANSKTISYLICTLQAYQEILEKQYPTEAFIAKKFLRSTGGINE